MKYLWFIFQNTVFAIPQWKERAHTLMSTSHSLRSWTWTSDWSRVKIGCFLLCVKPFYPRPGRLLQCVCVNENLWPVTFGLQNRPKISSKCCFQFCLPWMTAGKDGLLMLPWVNSFLLQRFPFRLHYVILLITWKALRTQHHLEHAFLVLQTGSQFWCLFSRLSNLGLMFLTNNTSEQLRKTFKCTHEA